MFGRLKNVTVRGYHTFVRRVLRANPPLDYQWVTDRIAVGAEIRTPQNMAKIADAGITHIVNLQEDVDDGQLGAPHGIKVHWEKVMDDYKPKPPEMFGRIIDFAQEALKDPNAKLYVHCYAGVHRGPLGALAILRSLGHSNNEAQFLIKSVRALADFPDVYVGSVDRHFLNTYGDVAIRPTIEPVPASPTEDEAT